MDYCTPQASRRHNPVDSICRKLQTIQWRGDREPNSPFQIPKLSSSSYDSPQRTLRHNLEAILKKGTFPRDEKVKEKDRGMGMPNSAASQRSSLGPFAPLSTPIRTPPTPTNITYTITSTLGERRGADGTNLKQAKTWQRYCSTPAGQPKESPYLTLTKGPHSTLPESDGTSRSPPLLHTFTPSNSTFTYDLNFCSADSNSTDSDLPYPALVVKRLSMGDGGPSVVSENKKNMAEISLICEENLLDTIFHACDTQRRGKVYVSHIVDYLRHTTSRTSEDSGLEELCNMLDPEHKDVSIDLDTYHAVMREWIDDCRNNGEESAEDINQDDSVKLRDAARSLLLNITSGSLEAFGGEASRAEFETSDLVYCVTDLQMSNQKLLEEVKKLKQVVESMEESNQKLAEENEELHTQARVNQQLAQKEKMLKEEVEEMKATLSCTEESRARASAHSKHMGRENQSLIAKIASLQDENFKITMETDELQKRIKDLRDINVDLQGQIHTFDAVITEKESAILEKSRRINELNTAVEEYCALTQLLRGEKSKLENQMQMILPDLAGASMSLSVAYRLNQSNLGSLETELALAQSPLEAPHGDDRFFTTMSLGSPLDETLDREVFLMLQAPNPEHMALEFKSLLNKLKRDFREDTDCVLSKVRGLLDDTTQQDGNTTGCLQTVQAELDNRRADWRASLDQLAQYTDSLEKELFKMASNMRRSRTEILHLQVRVQEQETQKRQLCEELEHLKTPQDSREASCQTPAPEEEEEPGEELDWDEEFALQDLLKNELASRNCWVQDRQGDGRCEEMDNRLSDRGEEDDGGERWTVVETAGEVRDASTPFSAGSVEAEIGQRAEEEGQDFTTSTESEPEVICQPLQEEAAAPLSAHSQAVSTRHPEADALPDLSHSESTGEGVCEGAESPSCGPTQTLSPPSQPDETITSGDIHPAAADMVSLNSTSPEAEDTINQSESCQLTCEDPGRDEEEDGLHSTASEMPRHKSLSRDHSADRSAAAEDSTSLLPVLVEEEESVPDSAAEAPAASPAGTDQPSSGELTTLPDSSSPQSGTIINDSTMSNTNSDSSDPKDLLRSSQAAEENTAQDERSETSVATERDSETSVISDVDDTVKEDRSSISPSDKEIEAEFQRLALGFKCDMFTLEKRLRLEERSRDLAEENVRREVSSCQGLLQALTPLCEDDGQSMEIIQRLQKNLEILIQSMTRVSSRSEMLGAIHQENRIGKAVEVMIQHVENLRRTYTKEHSELLELREALMQNERSFGSQKGKDDFHAKKQPSGYYKSSARRVSIAAIPRTGGSNMHFDMSKTQDCSEAEAERLTRRSPWNVAGKNMTRPPLKRFVSSAAWVDTEEPSDMMKGMASSNTDCQSEEEQKKSVPERRSSLSDLGRKFSSLIHPLKTNQDELFVMLPSPSSTPTSTEPGVAPSLSQSLSSSRAAAAAVARGSRGLWLWLAIVVVLAGLLALLASLVMQPAVDAAPVGTGDSWMAIQQLLWPYTGLRHNGQPPV
ncbi:inositol 1,4,5-triphosphate receptor associated 2 [Cololabis saira]|uniref:inositol 1,4,5-triphosphate receptor associated 2 n=1 Tax=Cololabis saira TaxID=129043 RepID=UPI002AD51A3C|nr:inositol 1,4,5-triphosphate receptor associated 2 [Cololabis saira]